MTDRGASAAGGRSAEDHSRRIVQAAEGMLAQLGEGGLQMKQLADRSGVALATLYRYYPSKDHVLGAIAIARTERALSRVGQRNFEGETAGERVANAVLANFAACRREPEIWVALQRVMTAPDRAMSGVVERVTDVLEETVLAAAGGDGEPVTAEQRLVLPIVISAFNGAVSLWFAGITSAEDVRARTTAAARLLDLPPDVVREYLAPRPPAA